MNLGLAAPSAAERETDRALTEAVLSALQKTALARVGVAAAEPFTSTRADLLERRAAGLHGGMSFTYRNPDRSTQPGRIVEDAASLVVGALGYLCADPEDDDDSRVDRVVTGRVARYVWTDSYRDLFFALEVGAGVLRAAGHKAVIVVDDNALVDREAARRAGIGWYGRNANLLLPGQGSWFVLGTIVTDAKLVPSAQVEPGCGSCSRCLEGCPTGAIVAPGVVDARRCLSWLLQAEGTFPRQWRVALGDRMYGCDECQEVCPPNISRQRRSLPSPEKGARAAVDVAAFLDDDDDTVIRAAGRWYVARRQARFLRRNALIVLGNAGDPSDPRVVGLLERALAHGDPIVRGHAVWAAARLGRLDLADGLVATEADPMVRDELDRRHEVAVRP